MKNNTRVSRYKALGLRSSFRPAVERSTPLKSFITVALCKILRVALCTATDAEYSHEAIMVAERGRQKFYPEGCNQSSFSSELKMQTSSIFCSNCLNLFFLNCMQYSWGLFFLLCFFSFTTYCTCKLK